jgi:hypothetical protein
MEVKPPKALALTTPPEVIAGGAEAAEPTVTPSKIGVGRVEALDARYAVREGTGEYALIVVADVLAGDKRKG